MFDRKNIALEVLSNCEFLSNQMFDRKNVALCLTEPLSQCVSGGQKFREVILRKCSDSAEYTPKLVNICSDSMKNTPPYSKVILRKCSDSAEYTPKFVNYL